MLPDKTTNFPYGACLVLNLSAKSLKFIHGDAETPIAPGSIRTTTPPKKTTTAGDATLAIKTTENGADELVYSTVWLHNPTVRTLVFILQDASGAIVVKQVRCPNTPEHEEAPQEKAKKPPAK